MIAPGEEVAVNLMWLRPGKVGGSESYIRRVLASLASNRPDIDLRLIGNPDSLGAVAPDGAQLVTPPITNQSRAARVAAERMWLSKVMDLRASILHHPGGTVPFVSETPTVMTIHDLQPLTNRANFSRTKRFYLDRAIPEAVQRADVIATPSDWVRNDVIERLGVAPDRVVTVSAYAHPTDLSEPTYPSPQLQKILDRGPTLVYPAMTLGHKNHKFLFDAFEAARMQDPTLQLVCTGVEGEDHDEIVAYAAAVSPAIYMLGYVSRRDLDALFARAEMLVFPSLYEGFGLPILEAQQAGLPVVATSCAAIPEVAGDGAVLLDPSDLDAWAGLMAARFSTNERAELVARGHANAQRYSSQLTALAQEGAYSLARS